jgi:hypothetical protein
VSEMLAQLRQLSPWMVGAASTLDICVGVMRRAPGVFSEAEAQRLADLVLELRAAAARAAQTVARASQTH